MKALVLDGAAALRDLGDQVLAALSPRLQARGYSVSRHDLGAIDIPACKGDFGCWTVTPGVCVQPGPHRDMARDLVQCDLAVWLTSVSFGGYSSALKKQLDHCIPLISPFMTTVDGETHHVTRYERAPSILAVGLTERFEADEAQVFERLVRRNVLNLHAPHWASAVVSRDELERLELLAPRWLDALDASTKPPVAATPLPLEARPDLPVAPAARVLLLVGSPRGSASVSATLAAHLSGLLTRHGISVATEVIESRSGDPELRGLAEGVAGADAVALVTPLYVDSLPAPVTKALEVLAGWRATVTGRRPRFLAVVNCGFPEAVHADTALAICRAFARRASMDWIGGLAIGGGGMFGGGRSIAEMGGRARFAARALELTAAAIARGEVIPREALDLARNLPIPAWLYRRIADLGFLREAWGRGATGRMGDRPYAR